MSLADIIKETGADYCSVSTIGDKSFELTVGKSYDYPEVNFETLLKLSKRYGTEKIDLDNYCNSTGCDTCGYGSDYGRTIQIYEATLNIGELRGYCKEDNIL